MIAETNLVCLPCAGAGSSVYRSWPDALGSRIQVRPVLLPGRELRFQEPLLETHQQVMHYLCEQVIPLCTPPFSLYGHSMGSRLAFELARELRRQGLPGPAKLLVSGAPAPRFGPPQRKLSELPGDELAGCLRRLGGTSELVLQHRELFELLLPMLRADFAVAEDYRYVAEPPLDCPVVAWGGWDDSYPRQSIASWAAEGSAPSRHYMVAGGHFFIHTAEREFLAALRREL